MFMQGRRSNHSGTGFPKGTEGACYRRLHAVLSVTAILALSSFWPSEAAEPASSHSLPVLSGCEYDYPPFCTGTDDGQAEGFAVDLLRASLKAMDRGVTFRVGVWAEIKQDLAEGRIQALPLVGRTPEREEIYDFTFPYLTLRGAIVVREGTEGITSLTDLRGKGVAVMKGDNAEEFMRRANVGASLVGTATFEVALSELSQGKHDAVVMQRLLALRLMAQEGIDNLQFVGGPLDAFAQDFCFAVKEGDTALLSVLNEGLALTMADGTFRTLHTKWFADQEPLARSRLVIGSDDNYPPYEYLDENGEPTGFNVALTRAVADLLGFDVVIWAAPWAEIRQALDAGEIDAIQGMFYSLPRDRKYEFSQPHGVVHHGIVVRKDMADLPSTMADLAGKRIAVLEMSRTYEFAVQYGYGSQLTGKANEEDALRELAQGKHDCVLAGRVPTRYLIEKNGWDNLVVVGEPLLTSEYCFSVLDENRILAARFSDALVELRQNGEYQRLRREWLGVYDDERMEAREFLRYASWVLVPLFLVMVLIAVWVWTLRRQVASRTRALRESEGRFSRAMDGASEGLWDWDLRTGEVYFSPHWKAMLGYRDDEIGGSYEEWERLLHPDDLDDARRIVDAYVKGQSDKLEFEFRMHHKDGHWVDILSRGGVDERGPDGTALRMTGTHVDISHQKQLEGQLREVVSELEHSNRELEEFAYVASHDLRSPLTALDSLTDWLAEDLGNDLSPQSADHMRLIRARVSRMQKLLDDLLEYSRAGQSSASVASVDVERLVRQSAELMTGEMPITVEAADLPTIKTAATPFRQVLSNLISNAAKHHDQDACTITVTSRDAGAYWEFRVIDDGPGIPPESQETVFGMFQALRPRDEREASGMGLALVRKLVEHYGGMVYIESSGERGTGVVFTWPKRIPKE
ncbi:MAG: transporter substrate-binding domain-containing protein [bacterium]|nr:transporter substrate-binding domain-containing protein [bacterium]